MNNHLVPVPVSLINSYLQRESREKQHLLYALFLSLSRVDTTTVVLIREIVFHSKEAYHH